MAHDLAKYMYEIGQMKRVQRSGWWLTGVSDPESVAEHSFRAAILGYILASSRGRRSDENSYALSLPRYHEAKIDDLHDGFR